MKKFHQLVATGQKALVDSTGKIHSMPKVITVEWLKRIRVCGDQIEIFEKEWPEGAEVTEENVIRALELGLDLAWLANRLTPTWDEMDVLHSDNVGDVEKARVFVKVWDMHKKGL